MHQVILRKSVILVAAALAAFALRAGPPFNTGNKDSSATVGLGNAFILSAQYAF